VDHFKDINDTSGHQAGDALMVQIATYLRRSLRAVDILGRLGGDEFAVILADTAASDASRIVKKISAGLAEQDFFFDGQGYRISLTTGITTFPADGTTVPELLANADMAMYQAKEAGRGGYHLFTAADQSRERLHTRILWKERIDAALSADGFVLHYQPILDIRSGQVNHYEVLVRMLGDDAQLQFPGQFIQVAEQTGQIRRIDQWVLNKAIRHLVQLVDRDANIRFSINLSGGTFNDPGLFPFLEALFREVGLDPCHVILEITETAAVADMTAARRTVETLTELGCQFALDDFGVGFTSFSYLKQLPVDYIKIDGAFIRTLSENSDDRFLVKAMAEVARGLGKKTVAEFVEQEACLGLLKRYGVDFAQGYFVGRPVPWTGKVLADPEANRNLPRQTQAEPSNPKPEGGVDGTRRTGIHELFGSSDESNG
jgi:diguanylate cyclase (GGDEF)-like protein